MKQLYFIYLLLFSFNCINSQSKQEKIEYYNNLYNNYRSNNNIDSVFNFVNQLHKKNLITNDKELIACSLYLFGKYYTDHSEMNKSLNYLNQSEKLALKNNNNLLLSYIYNMKGYITYCDGDNPKALEFYQKGLKISDKNNLFKSKSMILLNLSDIYSAEKDTINFLKSVKEGINIAEKKNYKDILSRGYPKLAQYFKKNKPEVAEKLYQSALNLAITDNNLKLQLETHINLSQLYLNNKKYRLNLVLYHLKKAEDLQTTFFDSNLQFYILFNYGAYYFKKNDFKNSISFYLQALETSKNLEIPPDRIKVIYEHLKDSYIKIKDYERASIYYENVLEINDSIFTIEKNNTFNELHTKYEVDKKNLKIDLLNKDNQLIKNRRDLIIYVALFIFIILIILIILYKNKIKFEKIRSQARQKNHENEIALMHKNKELSQIRAKYEGQNNERNRLSKEIHDGVGGSLAGLRLQLSQVNEELKSEKIETITNQLTTVFKELRAISHNLNLNYLEENDLNKLLKDLIDNYTKDKSMHIKLNIYPDDTLVDINKTLKVNLYRIFQELLHNTKKYANAKNVEITITQHDDFLNVIYDDDGVGFDINENKNGIGINNIKERISLFKGEINIESIKNKGTSVLINIPNIYE